MRAELLIHDKVKDRHGGIVEIKIWSVPKSKDRPHGYRFSLVYIKHGRRILGYDNAEGKGDHRHYGNKEMPYKLTSVKKLIEDFYKDLREVISHES